MILLFFFYNFDSLNFFPIVAVVRDNGGKVVFNDMPLYFPCPCRNSNPKVAQLMRVHVVTPKAPVNVILQPQVSTIKINIKLF